MNTSKTSEPSNWPDLAMAMWDGLTGRKAEICYQFDHLDVSIPHRVGEGCEYATWKLNGTLKIRTTDEAHS